MSTNLSGHTCEVSSHWTIMGPGNPSKLWNSLALVPGVEDIPETHYLDTTSALTLVNFLHVVD